MKIKKFIGTWESKDFPSYHFGDNIKIRLYIHPSLMATLWLFKDNDFNKTETISEGIISIIDGEYDKFKFVIDGNSIDDRYLELNARMFMDNKPTSVLIDIPEYGKRYFQKLE